MALSMAGPVGVAIDTVTQTLLSRQRGCERILVGWRRRPWRTMQTRSLLRPGEGLGIVEVVELIMRDTFESFLREPVISAAEA